MRSLDKCSVEIHGPKLSKFIDDWLDGNGPRIFNYNGHVFELDRFSDGQRESFSVLVNGEGRAEFYIHEIGGYGRNLCESEVFPDMQSDNEARTLYDYIALCRRRWSSTISYTNINNKYRKFIDVEKASLIGKYEVDKLREEMLEKFSKEYLEKKDYSILLKIPPFAVQRKNIEDEDIRAYYLDRDIVDYYSLFTELLFELMLFRIELGLAFEDVLRCTFVVGADKHLIENLRLHLATGTDKFRKIVTRNFVCHDPDTYDNSFNGTDLTDAELAAKNEFGLMW